MTYFPEKIALSAKSLTLLRKLMLENPRLAEVYSTSKTLDEAKERVKEWAFEVLNQNPIAVSYYTNEAKGRLTFENLRWQDFAAIRILDYLDNSGREFENPYRDGIKSLSVPFELLWLEIGRAHV